MEYVKSFRNLEVYKLSRQLSKEIFEISKGFPGEEMFSLTDQVRRSSRSIGGQIAATMFLMKYQKAYYGNMVPLEKC